MVVYEKSDNRRGGLHRSTSGAAFHTQFIMRLSLIICGVAFLATQLDAHSGQRLSSRKSICWNRKRCHSFPMIIRVSCLAAIIGVKRGLSRLKRLLTTFQWSASKWLSAIGKTRWRFAFASTVKPRWSARHFDYRCQRRCPLACLI